MIKRNTINEYRKIISVAFISLYDSYYFAVGMKVCNFLSVSMWQEGILTSTIPCEQIKIGKYSEAYVFSLVKSLKNRWPVTNLNFASLYSSLIIIYNLLSKKIILFWECAKSLKKSCKKLHEINFKFNNRDILIWSIKYEN